MSKQVDLNEKLSSDDREYLLQRNRWKEVQENDEEFGAEVGEDPAGPERSGTDPLSKDPAELTNPNGAGNTPPVEGDDVTKEDLKEILDSRGIEYKSNATKDELLSLVNG